MIRNASGTVAHSPGSMQNAFNGANGLFYNSGNTGYDRRTGWESGSAGNYASLLYNLSRVLVTGKENSSRTFTVQDWRRIA